ALFRWRFFERISDRVDFSFAERHQNNFPGLQDGADPLGNGQRWDFVDAAFKESGIILTSEFGEFTNMGGGVERCARFVEPDVAISSNAQKLQVDTAGCCNFLIVVINRADSGV